MSIYSPELRIQMIDYRINIMRHRDELGNMHLIKALMRERRQCEKECQNGR